MYASIKFIPLPNPHILYICALAKNKLVRTHSLSMLLFQEKSKLNKLSSFSALFGLLPLILFYTQDKSQVVLYFLTGIASIIIGVFLLLLFSNLTINVYSDKIVYRFFPFAKRFKEIRFSNVKKIEFTNVDPIHDFGGTWGVRKSKKYGKGYLSNGGEGIFIETEQGDKFFFTIENKEKLKRVLENIQLPNEPVI